MKKIKIITIHCIHNFGSLFQSYGLVQYLRSQGYDAKIIDYRPSYFFKGRSIIKRYVSILLNPISYFKQHGKYERFIKQNLSVTKEGYTTQQELVALSDDDTLFIAGGDQIWNSFHPCGRDDAYKLTFVKKGKKLAFGTSMGRNSFTSEELTALSEKIKDFISIGLREPSTVKMLAPYTNVPIKHVVDPVLLLRKDEYMKFIGEKPIIQEPYLVMYLAAKSELLDEAVNHIAEKNGLKIVHVCGFMKKCRCDYFLKSTGPEELLNLIYYSQFVISASFHATLFSILFEKQFITLLPEAGTNTRIEDLLVYYGLENRIVHNSSDIPNIDAVIDFSQISIKRDVFSEESKNELNRIIQSC